MDTQELWREDTYKNLSTEQRAEVLKLIHAYILGLKLPSNCEVDGSVITVFMGIIEGFRA